VKEDDVEIVLMSILAFYQFLKSPITRKVLVKETSNYQANHAYIAGVITFLIDLLYDENVEIRKVCDACLDIICVPFNYLPLTTGTRHAIRRQDKATEIYVA
jgi:Kinesin-associated protein (KAP)